MRICFQLVTSFPNVSVPDVMPRKLLVTGFCLSFSTVVMVTKPSARVDIFQEKVNYKCASLKKNFEIFIVLNCKCDNS